ncbi:UxaA family hydrolase [Cellulosimicrobium arenosum]|uniref:Altronate dehydratase n=1 Tax=Cellulosimicrobium arenosum TaxID=2708133 RepID=A0A927J092_9MICO|nr:altronate dehydratase family protein [Cellulosimicrobium arenosum]MBD8079403.1 altronate dehydratase [Cellulosimicrobium arenosum]
MTPVAAGSLPALLLLAAGDGVGVATRDLVPGEAVAADGVEPVGVRDAVPRGHKVALHDVAAGEPVRKYGQVIGLATTAVRAGDHVHVHNLGFDPGHRDHELATVHTELTAPAGPRPTFRGYRRANGRVGTRNYVAIVTSVNCSATTARMIADRFRGFATDAWPDVDGVVALTHGSGCGLVPTSPGAQTLLRTLRGYASHPNVAGVVVLGLGCEMLAVDQVVGGADISPDTVVRTLTIQETGGIRATVRAGVAAVREMLDEIDGRWSREDADVSELVLGLNCGGSDGYSGITANPALGVASDRLVAYGGTSALAETPEVFGAEHLLTRRAVRPEVAQRLLDRLDWWQEYATAGGGTLDNNPSPGNKDGGLTTILEKSLGAVAKGGRADLAAVHEYAEPMTTPGFVFMDTPGYDPVSVTGLIAGGATVVCFTTGRGSVFGSKPAPTIKLGTNSELYRRQGDDVDIDCGRIADGIATVDEVGDEIFARILAVASGEPTTSEDLDVGGEEFVPWQLGTVT